MTVDCGGDIGSVLEMRVPGTDAHIRVSIEVTWPAEAMRAQVDLARRTACLDVEKSVAAWFREARKQRAADPANWVEHAESG